MKTYHYLLHTVLIVTLLIIAGIEPALAQNLKSPETKTKIRLANQRQDAQVPDIARGMPTGFEDYTSVSYWNDAAVEGLRAITNSKEAWYSKEAKAIEEAIGERPPNPLDPEMEGDGVIERSTDIIGDLGIEAAQMFGNVPYIDTGIDYENAEDKKKFKEMRQKAFEETQNERFAGPLDQNIKEGVHNIQIEAKQNLEEVTARLDSFTGTTIVGGFLGKVPNVASNIWYLVLIIGVGALMTAIANEIQNHSQQNQRDNKGDATNNTVQGRSKKHSPYEAGRLPLDGAEAVMKYALKFMPVDPASKSASALPSPDAVGFGVVQKVLKFDEDLTAVIVEVAEEQGRTKRLAIQKIDSAVYKDSDEQVTVDSNTQADEVGLTKGAIVTFVYMGRDQGTGPTPVNLPADVDTEYIGAINAINKPVADPDQGLLVKVKFDIVPP